MSRQPSVFYFFHPLVWLANVRLRQLREMVCDDLAIAGLDQNRKDYGQSLLRVVEEASMRTMPGLAGAGFVEWRSSVARRLVRVMQPGYAPYRKVGGAALAAVAVMAFACVAGSSGSSKEAAEAPVPETQEAAIPEPEMVNGLSMDYRADVIRNTSVDVFFSRIQDTEPGYHHFAALRALGTKARTSDAATRNEIIRRASALLRGEAPPGYPRWMCCYVLSSTRDPQVIPALKAALTSDADVTTRGVAACALGEFDAATVDPILREARTRETNPEVVNWIDTALNGAYRKP